MDCLCRSAGGRRNMYKILVSDISELQRRAKKELEER
jgi:hypothetical protein